MSLSPVFIGVSLIDFDHTFVEGEATSVPETWNAKYLQARQTNDGIRVKGGWNANDAGVRLCPSRDDSVQTD
jgi:hypothetical protein